MAEPAAGVRIGPYTKAQWFVAGFFFIAYILTYSIFFKFFPSYPINPATSLLLAAIFFGGISLWPSALLATFFAQFFMTGTIEFSFLTASTVLQALVGGYALKKWDVDPIFRRDKDAFRMITVLAGVSLFTPLTSALQFLASEQLPPVELLRYQFVAAFFAYIMFTPFILRWTAKPGFRRTWREIFEVTTIFLVLCMVNAILFIDRDEIILGVPSNYLLLIPFSFIALRLRPRFLTLAFFITAIFALTSFVHETPATIFGSELLLSLYAMIFYVVAALEEHRRTASNQTQSQVATLKNAVARVTNESRAKNDFIAILAHELRNPLTPVVSGIELLKLRTQNQDDHTVLSSMQESMHTVRSLLNDLLDVSRISEGKVSLKKSTIDLEPVLESAVLSTEHHRKERHQTLVYKRPSKRLRIYADPLRVEQIFSNLLTNASKYSDEGDSIAISILQYDGFAEISITDQGVGLEKEALENIFEPFLQIEHGERTKEGLGIGLSLVKDFVKMHGGKVWAESEGRGKGSKFTVRLPLVEK